MTKRGELERAITEVLWAAQEPMTARAVVDALPERNLALTTVLTVLGRLEGKGLVLRDRDGRAHTYRPAAAREEHTADLIRQVLDSSGDRSGALVHFVESASAADLDILRRALAGR